MRHSKRNHSSTRSTSDVDFKVQDAEGASQCELAAAVTGILTQTLLHCLIFGALTAAHVAYLPL